MVQHAPQRLVSLVCLCGVLLLSSSSPAEKPGIWLDVPFVHQEKNGCGAAVIAMVMLYWQQQPVRANQSAPAQPPPAGEIQRQLYSRQAHGIYASAMEDFFKQHHYRTFAFAGEQNDLQQHLEKGRPLIVALKPALGETTLHYVVVVGLDRQQHLVMLNDPAQKKLLHKDWAEFENEWKAVGRWTLLALPE
jgi:uncharacterized protein YvpB